MFDNCPTHNTPARKEYDFGRLMPQPHVTVFTGCKCAGFDAEMPGGHESKLCRSYSEAQGMAKFALELWRAA